ncbi:MAG: hypothetical protein J0H98_03275 [Solirubrobacterales bacterium]|nr:hypothetical protein [Solirubrobacterales bacterium]
MIAKTDDAGKLTGSGCTDVIVAGEQTTAIEGGTGDDVIIGGPNTVVISGGSGWDYIVANSLSAVVFGDSGDDVIDAGRAPAPGELKSTKSCGKHMKRRKIRSKRISSSGKKRSTRIR